MHLDTPTSAMRVTGRIDKHVKTAMLAYVAILVGQCVRYTKVVFPKDSLFCQAVIESHNKLCSESYFDKYACTVRTVMNRHLNGGALGDLCSTCRVRRSLSPSDNQHVETSATCSFQSVSAISLSDPMSQM